MFRNLTYLYNGIRIFYQEQLEQDGFLLLHRRTIEHVSCRDSVMRSTAVRGIHRVNMIVKTTNAARP